MIFHRIRPTILLGLAILALTLTLVPVVSSQAQAPTFTVYLGFDDGPTSVNTERILDILDRYHIKATFFPQGSNIKGRGREALLQRMLREGHHLGNHLWSHELNVMAQNNPSPNLLLTTFDGVEADVHTAVGDDLWTLYNNEEPIKPFRWPGGAVRAFPRANVITYNWQVTAGDDVPHGITATQVVYNVLYGYPPYHYYGVFAWGDGAVILLHDESSSMVAALPLIIEDLQAYNVTFGTLPRPGDTPGTMPIRIGDVPPCANKPGNCRWEYYKYPLKVSLDGLMPK